MEETFHHEEPLRFVPSRISKIQRSYLTVVVCAKTRRRRRYTGRLSPDGVKIEIKIIVCVVVSSGGWEGLGVRTILDGPIHTFQTPAVVEVVTGRSINRGDAETAGGKRLFIEAQRSLISSGIGSGVGRENGTEMFEHW